jgi:hypothetical protein
VLKLAGRSEEARAEGERALELYEQKGLVPAIEQTRSFLAELVAGAQNDPALAARRAPRRAR